MKRFLKAQTKLYKWAMRFLTEYNKTQPKLQPVVYIRHDEDGNYVIIADAFNAEIMLAAVGITGRQHGNRYLPSDKRRKQTSPGGGLIVSDNCKHCTARGDLDKCESVECFRHESWYAVTLKQKIQSLEAELESQSKAYGLAMTENADLKRTIEIERKSAQKHYAGINTERNLLAQKNTELRREVERLTETIKHGYHSASRKGK